MSVLFAGGTGKVILLNDPSVQGVLPLVGVNPLINFQTQKSLITRITLAQETNHQFLHTLGGDIYIYVFGDRIGQMTISGLAVAVDCNDQDNTQHGFELMMAWYNTNKLSVRKTPVTVMIGQTPITGFVAGLNGSVFDHRLFLMQFDLMIMVMPQKNIAPETTSDAATVNA